MKFYSKKLSFLLLALSSISITFFLLSTKGFHDDYFWLGRCWSYESLLDVFKSLYNPSSDNRIFYNTFICFIFKLFQNNWYFYKILVLILIIVSSYLLTLILREYALIKFEYKLNSSEIISIICLFLIFPSAPSFTSWASSFGHLSFFTIFLLNLYLIIYFKKSYLFIYIILNFFIALQYEIYATVMLANMVIFFDMYKKKLVNINFIILAAASKIICLILSIFLFVNISGKNLSFFSKIENIIIIFFKDIMYFLYSIYSFYNLLSLLIIIGIFYYWKKIMLFINNIKKISFLKDNLYPIIGIFLFIGTINSGGYPFSLVELHGRLTLIFSYFYLFLFLFFFIKSNNKKKLFLAHFIIFISAYISSAFAFITVKKNQDLAVQKIEKVLNQEKKENLIIFNSKNKTMFFESDLNKYFINKLNIKRNEDSYIYVINNKTRCFILDDQKFSLFIINNKAKAFLNKENRLRKIVELKLKKNKKINLINEENYMVIKNIDTC